MRFVLFFLTFTLLLNPGFAMDDEEKTTSSSVVKKDVGSEKENDEENDEYYDSIPLEEFGLFTILNNPESGVEYTLPFKKDPNPSLAGSYNKYIHGWLEVTWKEKAEQWSKKVMGALIGPNQVIIPIYHLKDFSTWNPSKITFSPVGTSSFVEAYSDDVIVFNDKQIERIIPQKRTELPSDGACIFFLKEAVGNKKGYAGLGAVSGNFLRTPDIHLAGTQVNKEKGTMGIYVKESTITTMGEFFFVVSAESVPNQMNEFVFSQLPNTLGYSVIGYAGSQSDTFQRFTTSSLNNLIETLNNSPNSKRPTAQLPALQLGTVSHYGAIQDFSIVPSEKSTESPILAKGKVPSRDFSLEYPEDSGKALEGNLPHWAYIYVEDQTFLRALFLLMKPASAFHPLAANMIPVLFRFYYDPNNLKLLNKKIDLKKFYDTALAQLAFLLASTIQQAGLDPTTTDIEKQLSLFPEEQRESWKFIIEPFQLQIRMKNEFARLEQEVKSGNLKSLCSLALCYIWGWGCEQVIDKAIEYLETGVKETETFKEARALVEGVKPSDIYLETNEALAQVYEILGHLYSYKGVQEKARANYTKLANINSDGDVHLANYYFTRKENGKAFGHLKTAIKKRNSIALRAWIKLREEDRKEGWELVSRFSNLEHTNVEEFKPLLRALNTKIQANKLKSLLERIESGNLGIRAFPLLWSHYFFGHGCTQDYFLAALCYAIPYIALRFDILQELDFSNAKELVSLFRSSGEKEKKDKVVLKLQELAEKTIMKRMGIDEPYKAKYLNELFQKASEGDDNARSCLGHCYMLKQDAEKAAQPNFQKAAVTFYVANGKKNALWKLLFEWLAIDDASKSRNHPFITSLLKAEEANWLSPEDRNKESEKVDIEWIQLCENLGEMGYPIGWYKAAQYSLEYAPSYALTCLSQVVEAYHPKLDALRARLYFTVEGIFGMQENGEEDPEKKMSRQKKALDYWKNVTTNGQGKVQGEAQYYAGVCHLQGWGTKINIQHAVELLKLAKANGYQPNDKTISSFKKEEILKFYKDTPMNKPNESRFLSWE